MVSTALIVLIVFIIGSAAELARQSYPDVQHSLDEHYVLSPKDVPTGERFVPTYHFRPAPNDRVEALRKALDSHKPLPDDRTQAAHESGMRVRFEPAHANTGPIVKLQQKAMTAPIIPRHYTPYDGKTLPKLSKGCKLKLVLSTGDRMDTKENPSMKTPGSLWDVANLYHVKAYRIIKPKSKTKKPAAKKPRGRKS